MNYRTWEKKKRKEVILQPFLWRWSNKLTKALPTNQSCFGGPNTSSGKGNAQTETRFRDRVAPGTSPPSFAHVPPGRMVASVWRQGHCPHVTCLTNGFLAARTITLFTELLGLVHLLNTSEYWHRANAGQHVVEHCIKTLDFSFHTAVVSNSLEPVNSLPSSLGGFQYPLRGTVLVLCDHSLTELWLLAPYACKNKNKKNTTLQALVA